METLASLLCIEEIRKPTVIVQSCSSKADEFIAEWTKRFELKCRRNPHLVLPTLHNVLGVMLRDARIRYGAESTDLRTSMLVIQDSGAGKKPAMEFAESIVRGVLPTYQIARRSVLTSAGAVGSLIEGEIVDPTTKARVKDYVPEYGDLKNIDYLLVSEAGSLLETKSDPFGNDLVRNICESQDTDNLISKKLAKGTIPPFTSKTVLSLWTVPPANISELITRSGLIQRFIFVFKRVPMDEYEALSDELIQNIGSEIDEKANVQPLIDELKRKPMIAEFAYPEVTKKLILEKKKAFDATLLDAGERYIRELKSFTIRRDLMLVKIATQPAWLDERSEVQPKDIEYAFPIIDQLWNNLLSFVEDLWGSGYSNKETIAIELLKIEEQIPINEFYKRFMEAAKCEEALARRIAARLEDKGIIKRFGEKSKRRIVRLK